MDFNGNKAWEFCTEHCFATQSNCALLPFNRAYHTDAFSDDEVHQIKHFFGMLPFTWPIESSDMHAAQVLQRNGLQRNNLVIAAMKADLASVPFVVSSPAITIRQIPMSNISTWLDIVSRCFSYYTYDDLAKGMAYILSKGASAVVLYIGFYNNLPSAAGMMIYHGDIITLHMICTLPECRKKGLGSAMMHTLLHDALDHKCTQALLISSQAGKFLYEQLGFKEYASYHIYYHKP